MVKGLIIQFILSSLVFAQQLSSTVSSNNINLTESVIYTIKISEIDENPSVDIQSLKNTFSIIAGPNIGSEYRFINGKRSSSRSISWTLIPLKEGKLKIPSFDVKVLDKTFTTKSHEVKVSKKTVADVTKDLFLELKVSKKNVVVGEQIILSYTFYTRVASKVLSTEFPKYNDFWVEKLFDPAGMQFTPESWKDIEIEGFNYKSLKIYEVALFPLQVGEFDLESMIMKIETKNKDSSFNRLFWEDPFFDTFSQRTKAKILVSDPVSIKVSSIGNTPVGFTGAVGKFNVSTMLSETSIDEGSPTVLKVILEGEGNLENIGRPKINFPNDIDIFEGETTISKDISSNLSGSITWKYNLIPRKNGLYQIDAVKIPYYNSSTRSWSSTMSEPLKLNINKSTAFDISDKDIISQNSKIMVYNKLGNQRWISNSDFVAEKSIIYIFAISFFLFLLPFYKNNFKILKSRITAFISFKSALNSAVNSLRNTNSMFIDGPRIITIFFYKKKIIKSMNVDISTLKNDSKKKIKKEDFELLANFLDDCQRKTYSQLDRLENNRKAINMLIKTLTKIDTYV